MIVFWFGQEDSTLKKQFFRHHGIMQTPRFRLGTNFIKAHFWHLAPEREATGLR